MRLYDLAPDVLVLAAAVGLFLSLRVAGEASISWRRWAALAAAMLALGLELWLGATIGSFGGAWQQDRFSLFAKGALLLGLVALVAVADWEDERTWAAAPFAFLAVFAGMVAASATSLISLWVGLELAALAGVAAAGSASSTLRRRLLMVLGAAAVLVTVGFATVWAVAGSSTLSAVQRALISHHPGVPLALAVLVLLAGLAVWVGLAPFHSAVVEGGAAAPAAAASVLGGLVAGAALVVAAKLLAALVGANPAWAPWLSWVAAFTILVSGLRALAGVPLRSLSAWLLLGQAGWIAAALAAHDRRSVAAALFLTGAMLVAGTAAPILAQEVDAGTGPQGLARRDPLRAAGLTVALLSLAGAPPLAGFFGEFAVAGELVRSGLGWVLGVGLLGWVAAVAGLARPIHAFFLETGALETRRGARVPVVWTVAALVPAVLVLAYVVFAYPVSDLAAQGAVALGLR
ncbi:MAG: hypothetical protein J2P45_06120 [Candidatus Dormibacteraeota bacterium]|nr:hypothetical protein [Candidatus Dormibacteraeota bacterium]